ncbi:Crossover junction endodeoxyribonuclease RuvC [Moorella glycerini]|uniref:Holliday junction resolvase n=1 Tax=Neomoorella stamsii TaxID=1266720 RepID=A0A9X7P4Z0_9FIRM|nr:MULTISPECIES: crossover junction endodeoxyribonuclease RuvC [Moorella]PRR69616.1 Holliday junction resolvase [Moorella stamsii]CEP67860.1 Crossover junction endodeoxyribonuclease RuvC [Moorella glycerini]CEP68730.1 Crossover junction endodeoxyribonuclease RuvC [Moorella glycerini]
MPTVMGIDPSLTSTGLVALENGNLILHETLEVKEKGIARLLTLQNILERRLFAYKPDLVVVEGYAFARSNQAHQMGELGGMIRMLLTQKRVPWIEVAPTQVKKFATGKGNSPKDIILRDVYKRWGVEFDSSDEADAFVLAKIGQAVLGDIKGLTQEQVKIVKAIKKKDMAA